MDGCKKLDYFIKSFSSYSASYLPENIRENSPSNQCSRWSSESNSPPQYLTLKLYKPSIVKFIKFGKYEKSHVCNLKKFRVLGGMEEKNLFQMFEGGLKNDSSPEFFELRHKTNHGEFIPLQIIQIIPLLSWGPSFNFSIWYVELIGICDDLFVMNSLRSFNDQREKTTIRLMLKHLRNMGYLDAFKALSQETDVKLEDGVITNLYLCLVDNGEFGKSEMIMQNFIDDGYVEEYISKQKYKANYEITLQRNDQPKPKNRVGASFALNEKEQIIYMFGGSDETSRELDDLWTYDLVNNRWELIQEHSELCNGPCRRAGHKMTYDPTTSQLFMIGRKSKANEACKSDFYLFDTKNKTWFLICEDTSLENGPSLIADHEICISSEQRMIYVFGGRSDESSEYFSGLYSYHINTNTWNLIFLDTNHPLAANPEVQSVKSRVHHSMIFDNKNNKIYIFGGHHKGKEYCNDFVQYDIENNEIATLQTTVAPDTNNDGTIFSGNTHATIDVEKGEIYMLLRDNKREMDCFTHSLWLFSLATREWSVIYKSYDQAQNNFSDIHFFAFCISTRKHYLIGDNTERTDSILCLSLVKPSRENILNYCKYIIRKQEYEEITRNDSLSAVFYLQNKLSETIDKSDTNQLNEFHKLASLLFCNKSNEANLASSTDTTKEQNFIRTQRSILFNKLIEILPSEDILCQPRGNLTDFISI